MLSLSVNRLIALFVVVVCVVTMTLLGVWQLNRMEQKQSRLASIAQKQSKESLNIETAMGLDDPRDIRVIFSALPDTRHILLLDNQIHQGRTGYDVIVPVMSNAGWILVNYGWLPAPRYRSELPKIRLPDEKRTFTGMVGLPSRNPMVTETATDTGNFPRIIQQLDTSLISRWLGTPLSPYVVTLTEYDKQFVRDWTPVVMSPEKHLGYAIQWFALAVAAAIIGYIAIFKRKSV